MFKTILAEIQRIFIACNHLQPSTLRAVKEQKSLVSKKCFFFFFNGKNLRAYL